GMLNGNQRLMYCGGLTPIHGREFEPVCGKPQAPPRAVVIGVRGRRVDGLRKLIDWLRKQRSPALWAGLRNQSTRADGLLGGLLRLLRAFSRLGGLLVMLLVRGLGRAAGCSAAGAVAGASAAITGPASRARATTGTSFL